VYSSTSDATPVFHSPSDSSCWRVFKAQRLCVSLNSRLESKKKKVEAKPVGAGFGVWGLGRVPGLVCRVWGLGVMVCLLEPGLPAAHEHADVDPPLQLPNQLTSVVI